ncbi:MAG TPA: tetratricopeptide repeat protein [Terriglobales bacterium]
MKKQAWKAGFFSCVLAVAAAGQTFDVKGQGGKQSGSGNNLGWGSGIEVARQARAAQDALKQNDYASAASHAEAAAKAAPQDAELWFLLGYCDRLAGRYPASVEAYQHGLARQPNSIRGLAGLAQTYVKMGRDDEARQLLTRVVQSNPRDPDSLALAGELFLESDAPRALDLLRRAETQKPSAHTELMVARAYMRLNQPEEAKTFLNRAKSRAPHDPDILRAVAGQYRDAGQYKQAISTLQSVPRKTPDLLAELAYTYELAGDKQEAADTYAKAAKMAKGNIGYVLSAAQALVGLGQMDEARGFLDTAKALNPGHYRLHTIQAQIAVAEDRPADAIAEYQAALSSLPPGAPEGPLYPVQLRLNLHELEQATDPAAAKQQLDLAAAQLSQIQVPTSSRPEYLRLRAAIEAQQGNLDAADKDLKEALALAPDNVNSLLNYGTLLWKLGQKDAARATFEKVLGKDQDNRSALSSLGFLARDMGNPKAAEEYFLRVAKLHPKDAGSHLALGDLYLAERQFDKALASYQAAYKYNQSNPLIVAGGANAALESHHLDLAKTWLDRAKGPMSSNADVMRERQRYLTWKGEYQEAADLGYKVLEKVPADKEAPVYLAYDLYYLHRYDEAFDLATKYDSILPKNRDLALIEGYVHVRRSMNEEALADFTRALERDPKMSTGYVNRGFVLNSLRQPEKAVKDFQTAIQLQPDYPEAHLGLGFSYLQLHRPRTAVAELDLAKKKLGDNRVWHLARAEAFRQEQNYSSAEKEYRVALKDDPNDLPTQLALGEALYRLHRYNDAIATYNIALKLSPADPMIYASLAKTYAKLGQNADAMRYIQSAEQYGKGQADVFMQTGDALLIMGEHDAAMLRFSRALETEDRVGIRLAIAQIFLHDGKEDEARRQIALGFGEAQSGDAPPVTAEDLIGAANLFLAMHDFELAQSYFTKARQIGASDRVVMLGLANTYLAEGNADKAEVELAKIGNSADFQGDYDYLMAVANMYRQRQQTVHALSAFAQASNMATSDSNQEGLTRTEFELAGQEGRQINQTFSLFSEASFAPQLEDINVYTLDSRLLGVTDPTLLPTPRHSYQSVGAAHYRVHLNGWPAISGFVGESLTDGRISLPSTNTIVNRHTFDTMFNGGISPVLHLGDNTITLNGGLQFTLRRDTLSAHDMNQNLFRQFLYVSTSSFFNWVSIRASGAHETGPFLERDLSSRDFYGNLEFTVGRPWGKTSVISGYSMRDLRFRPLFREYFSTASYVGLQHHFGKHFTAAVLGEYLRSWRVSALNFAIAQAIRPGARFEYRPTPRWTIQGSFVLSRGEGFHDYDNAQSEILVSYVRPVRGGLEDGNGPVEVAYPNRFSFGVQQQTFYNFAGQNRTAILPVVRFTLF